MKLTVHDHKVQTSVGLVYRWMHGIKEPTYGYPNCNSSQILLFAGYVQANLCIPELLFGSILWTISILGQLCLGIRVLAWYIYPNGIKNKSTDKNPYPTGKEKVKKLLWIPEWYQKKIWITHRYLDSIKKKTIPVQHWVNLLVDKTGNIIVITLNQQERWTGTQHYYGPASTRDRKECSDGHPHHKLHNNGGSPYLTIPQCVLCDFP